MEKHKISLSSLVLTSHCFNVLMDEIYDNLEKQYPDILKSGVGQIFGFGNFDPNKPSLKTELQNIYGGFINGKYLYDKKREVKSGRPTVKFNKPYKTLLFEYLGYDNISAFLNKHVLDEDERAKQLALLDADHKNLTHYYVSYHFGEYKEIVKSEVTVKDNWKNIEYKYFYLQDDGSYKTFIYYGDIKQRADALHINTRTFMGGKMVPGGENIIYIGYGDPAKSKYMLGVFSAFDINNRLIAVKSIYEKCSSKEEMHSLAISKTIPGYIAQEIRNQRIENEIHIPNNKLEISDKSPYYLTYEKIAGDYTFNFIEKDLVNLSIRIDPNNFKISSKDSSVLINKDDIEVIHNGSILKISLKLSGLSSFLRLDIYVKTYNLIENENDCVGKYCGVDFENRLEHGEVSIKFKSAKTDDNT